LQQLLLLLQFLPLLTQQLLLLLLTQLTLRLQRSKIGAVELLGLEAASAMESLRAATRLQTVGGGAATFR